MLADNVMSNPKLPLRQAWQNWIDCLKGDDPNAVFQQIPRMLWDTAIFRIILEGRKAHIRKNPQAPEINAALHSFIDRNYFQSQVIAIRRLTDTSKGANLTGKWGIYSLASIIEDIRRYRHDLTRAAFFELRNKPYDDTEVQRRKQEYLRKQPPAKCVSIPSELDTESIVELHQTFDRLSGKTPQNRQPEDRIDERVLTRLQEKLAVCRPITNYVDKFIAHAAAPESRTIIETDKYEITLKKLWNAHQVIYQVAEFLSAVLFSLEHMVLPVVDPGFHDFWDKPLVETEESSCPGSVMEAYTQETENWRLNCMQEMWQWIET